jgi:hypothetical protein
VPIRPPPIVFRLTGTRRGGDRGIDQFRQGRHICTFGATNLKGCSALLHDRYYGLIADERTQSPAVEKEQI